MFSRSMLMGLVALTVVSSAVEAATLAGVTGRVLVNRGSGFVPAADGTQLNSGDRVLTPRNGTARIVYNPACVEEVPSGRTSTVQDPPPCAGGLGQAGLVLLGVAGVATGIIVLTKDSDNPRPVPVSP